MNLGKFMSNELLSLLIAMSIHIVSSIFLKSWKLPSLLNPLAKRGEEILSGTALFPEEGFHVVDVGAYRGWYTTLSSKMVGQRGLVYSFEPEPSNFKILSRVALLNGLKNTHLFRLALSDKDGFEFLYLSEHPSMHSIVLRRGAKRISVPCVKLDTIVKLMKVPKLDLIKIDVEGAELKVLKGCKKSIREFNPIFSIDVNHYNGEFEEVRAFMQDFNYKIYPLFGEANKPYSIVAYPSCKEDLVKHLINRTKELSSRCFRIN